MHPERPSTIATELAVKARPHRDPPALMRGGYAARLGRRLESVDSTGSFTVLQGVDRLHHVGTAVTTVGDVNVLTLGTEHAAAAVALWQECGLTRPWNDPSADFHRAVDSPNAAVLGVFDGRRLVGTAMVGGDGHRGWVYYVATSPDHRGQRIGRRLMSAAEEWLVERGLPKIQFMVRSGNTSVLDFYAHLGYEEQDCVVLGRRLDGAVGMDRGQSSVRAKANNATT